MSLSDTPWKCLWQSQPHGTLSAARKVVPSVAQIRFQTCADKTISRNAEAANAMPLDLGLFSICYFFFNAVKWQGLSLLANCNSVIVQNYRIFKAIFFEKGEISIKKGYSWTVPLKL